MGVLYSCVVPGSGNIIGGKSAVIRHYAKNSTDALITRAGLKSAFGFNPMKTNTWKGKRPTTRMGAFSILRAKLDDVRQKVIPIKVDYWELSALFPVAAANCQCPGPG